MLTLTADNRPRMSASLQVIKCCRRADPTDTGRIPIETMHGLCNQLLYPTNPQQFARAVRLFTEVNRSDRKLFVCYRSFLLSLTQQHRTTHPTTKDDQQTTELLAAIDDLLSGSQSNSSIESHFLSSLDRDPLNTARSDIFLTFSPTTAHYIAEKDRTTVDLTYNLSSLV